MGVGSSRSHAVPLSGVFEREYDEVRTLLRGILTDGDLFRNPKYNMFLKGKCEEMTLVARKRLERHPKFQVQSLRDDLFVVPNDDMSDTKHNMCNAISMYYARVLKLFYVVKYVYDVETHGDYSIAGIVLRNIQTRDGLVEARYCGTPQEELGSFDKGVDFAKLSGFQVFVNDFLTSREREVFLGHLRELLRKGDIRYLRRWVCKDMLVPNASYAAIYGTKIQCGGGKGGGGKGGGGKGGGGTDASILVKVAENNPVLSWQLCSTPKSHFAKESPQITKAIRHMQKRYRDNIERVRKELESLIERPSAASVGDASFGLRSVSHEELGKIERRVKGAIVEFFVEAFVNYRHVLSETEKSSINRNA